MPKMCNLSARTANAQATVFAKLLDGGTLVFYDGEPPASASSPVNGQNRGAICRFGDPAFQPPKGGVIVSNPIEPGAVEHRIFATWARLYSSDGRGVMDVNVGRTDQTVVLPTNEFIPGTYVNITEFRHAVTTTSAGEGPME